MHYPTPTDANTAGQRSRRHIGLLLFDDAEELDAVGPWEVLAYWTLHHPEDGWSISCLSAVDGDVTGVGCAQQAKPRAAPPRCRSTSVPAR